MADTTTKSKRPDDTPFKQQKMPSWQPILTPIKIIGIFLLIGIVFVPVGVVLRNASNNIYEKSVTYDGKNVDEAQACRITETDQAKNCVINLTITEDISEPLYVYYELKNFYQNHRRYVKSRHALQLQGQDSSRSSVKVDCDPLYDYEEKDASGNTVNTLLLNPCGLIANSLFNDVIQLMPNTDGYVMDESSISWQSDRDEKFKQVDGFTSKCVASTDPAPMCSDLGSSYSDCKNYTFPSTGQQCVYWYPHDDETQYLYESYPMVVNPIEGVENEHFIVWMRTAGLPTFRKLYGKIDKHVRSGTVLSFNVSANFEVDSFDGTKTLVVSTVGKFGGKNSFLGVAYIVVGSICFFLAFVFAIKQIKQPRVLGDTSYLGWST